MNDAPDDIASLPFERALAELEAIVDQLEKGAVPLEQSIAIYERGENLKKHCEALSRAPKSASKRSPSAPTASRKAASRST